MSSKSKIILSAIIIAQILLSLFCFSRQGSFFYWDSYYTFKSAHYISGSTPGNHYIVDDPEFVSDDWMDVGFVRDTLEVDQDESVLHDSVRTIISGILHSPYWMLLNVFEALISPGRISGLAAIILNLILFIPIQLILYRLVYRYSADDNDDDRIALLTIILFGFSGMGISLLSYARFYIFSILLCILFSYLHTVMWSLPAKRWYLILLIEGCAMLFALWNIELSQFSLFYVCLFIVFFALALMVTGRYHELFIYGTPVFLGGGFYLAFKTLYIRMLMHPEEFVNNLDYSGPVHWVLDMLLTLTPASFAERSIHEISLIGQFAYGYRVIFVFFVILVIVYIVYKCRHFDSMVISSKEHKKTNFLGDKLNLFSHPMEYVMFATMVGYLLVACALHFYTEVRYSCHVFPLIAWFTAVVLIRFRDEFKDRKWSIAPIIVVATSVIISTVSGQRVVYVYDYGDDVVDYIDEHDIDEFVVSYYGDGNVSTDIIYQAVYLFDDDDRFMAVSSAESVSDKLTESFLLVTRHDMDQYQEYNDLGYDYIWTEDVGVYRFYYLQLSTEEDSGV